MNFETLHDLWPLAVAVIGIVLTWGNLMWSLRDLQKRLKQLEDNEKDRNKSEDEIKIQLAQIQTDLSWIRAALSKLNK